MSSKFTKDSYGESVTTWDEMINVLMEMDMVSEWRNDVELRKLQVLPVTAQDVKDNCDPVAVEDTEISGSKLAVRLPDGEIYCLRSQGVDSLHSRAGIAGPAYGPGKLPPEIEASHLNDGLSEVVTGKRKSCIRIVGDKILALHSQEYNPYSMAEGFGEAMNFFNTEYPDAVFKSGSIDHEFAQAVIDLSFYNDTIFASVKEFFGATEIRPMLGVSMGDSAKACVSLIPQVYVSVEDLNGTRIMLDVPLGKEMKVKHRGKGNMSDLFSRNLRNLKVQFEEPIMKLKKLRSIEIEHPIDTFMNACESINITKLYAKATSQTAEIFSQEVMEGQINGKIFNAFDVYMGMCRIALQVEKNDPSSYKKQGFKCKETLKRALNINWQNQDYLRK